MALITKGQRFERWTILQDQQYAFTRKIQAQCDCGTKRKIDISNLREGRSRSCGCINKENLVAFGPNRRKHPLNPGDVYGRLTIINSTNRYKVLCQCSCGNTHIAVGSSLYGGSTRSCGCIKRELIAKLGRDKAPHGGASNSTLFGTWQRICKGTVSVHQPWRQSALLFVTQVEQAIGVRPAGGFLRMTDNTLGYVPGNVIWGSRPPLPRYPAKLTPEQRTEIATLVSQGQTQTAVAKQYGVSKSLVSGIHRKHRAQ